MAISATYSIFLTFALLYVVSSYDDEGKYGIMFPDVNRNMPELYVCTPIKLDNTTDYYIVGFEPNATTKKVHHFVLYGCLTPGSTNTLWNCGHLSNNFVNSALEVSSPCGSNPVILYAWARDAPSLQLPPEVGFRVGGNTNIQYLVLQLHNVATDKSKGKGHDHGLSANLIPDVSNETPDTLIGGLYIHYTQQPVTKLAGVYILGAAGRILPMSEEHWDVACTIVEDKTIHLFAIRTHAHHLGTVSSGYRVITDSNGTHHWTLVGKLDPQKPHMFYPIANNITVTKGDILWEFKNSCTIVIPYKVDNTSGCLLTLCISWTTSQDIFTANITLMQAARCSYLSTRKTTTYMGPLDDDETCNFYFMYYVDEGEPLDTVQCWSNGAPEYYWDLELNNIPADSSTPDNIISR